VPDVDKVVGLIRSIAHMLSVSIASAPHERQESPLCVDWTLLPLVEICQPPYSLPSSAPVGLTDRLYSKS
jgi:hypothetical protein